MKGSREQRHQWTVYLRQRGDEPEPVYGLRRLDPAAPTSRNRYAAAIYDPYVPDIVFAEVLVIPEWTQATLSAEAIRLNGGIPPPPEPILPSQFTIQLYNPDQQVAVRYKPKTWSSNPSWEFEMPQRTFRQPSVSTLDRTQNNPAATDVTPKLRFSWRKEGKLSKDLVCLLLGKTSAIPESKTKSKEPDITISIFKGLKELTLYEPNLYRVEMEDFKGLEVVLLLGAMAIRDIYFAPMKEAFNLSNPPSPVGQLAVGKQPTPPPTRLSPSAGPKTKANGVVEGTANKLPGRLPNGTASRPPGAPQQKPQVTTHHTRPTDPQPPPLDPRSQWEIDAEQTRLRKEHAQEQLKVQERAREEERRTKKLLEAEEKARRKKQAEIDKETKRLQKLFGKEEEKARAQVQQQQQQQQQRPPPQHPRPQQRQTPSRPHLVPGGSGPCLQVPGAAGHARTQSALHVAPPPQQQQHHHHHPPLPRPQSVTFLGQHHQLRVGQSPQPQPQPQLQPPQLQQKKSSFFGLRKSAGEDKNKLTKKRSSMF